MIDSNLPGKLTLSFSCCFGLCYTIITTAKQIRIYLIFIFWLKVTEAFFILTQAYETFLFKNLEPSHNSNPYAVNGNSRSEDTVHYNVSFFGIKIILGSNARGLTGSNRTHETWLVVRKASQISPGRAEPQVLQYSEDLILLLSLALLIALLLPHPT